MSDLSQFTGSLGASMLARTPTPNVRSYAYRVVLAMLLSLVTTSGVGAVDIWISEVGAVGGGVGADDRLLTRCASLGSISDQELSVWVERSGSDPFDLSAIDLNIIADSAGIIEFTGVTVHNPTSGGGNRWERVDETVGLTPIHEMIGFGGFNLSSGAGIGSTGSGSDSLYDAAANAWLLATVTYNVSLTAGSGSTALYLEVGANGIAGVDSIGTPVDSSSITVLFGDELVSGLNASTDRDSHVGQASDGTIHAGTFAGDLDGDCQVGISDLNLVLFNWNSAPNGLPDSWINGRPGALELVGSNQLNEVLFSWGNNYPLPVSLIPEPSSLVLLGLGLLGLCNRSRPW